MIPDLFNPHPEGPDALEQGCFLVDRWRSRRVALPVRIAFGPPLDEEGQPMERSGRWQIWIAGKLFGDEDDPPRPFGWPLADLDGIWPECRKNPTSEADYEFRVARREWALEHDEDDAHAGARIDPMTVKLPFMDRA